MKFVVFGLTISSSWGNGHATLWRGLARALTNEGHQLTFFERDVPYYAGNRDLDQLWDGAELLLYADWRVIAAKALREVKTADVAIVTSYCPDARAASAMLLENAPGAKLYYDLDTPVTLARVAAGDDVSYLPQSGLGDFDLVLSYTGGPALEALHRVLGARRAAPLYGHVDPARHKPAPQHSGPAADLSYLGTYAPDRQQTLETLFIEPARQRPRCSFVLGGSTYPSEIAWPANVRHLGHVPPSQHPNFFSSSRLTLNITRGEMAAMGWCPSGRLFEAAACGTAILSDWWAGLDQFFEPGGEILVGHDTSDALAALALGEQEVRVIGSRARQRVLDEHTSAHRARELLELISATAPRIPLEIEAAEG